MSHDALGNSPRPTSRMARKSAPGDARNLRRAMKDLSMSTATPFSSADARLMEAASQAFAGVARGMHVLGDGHIVTMRKALEHANDEHARYLALHAMCAALLVPGDTVVIHGLEGRKELNGRLGTGNGDDVGDAAGEISGQWFGF